MTKTRQHYEKQSLVLSKNTSAIQVLCDEVGRKRMGTLLQLPEGAQLETCGEGFDEKTIKVCLQGAYYYVFLADIETAEVGAKATRTLAAAM